MLMLTVLFNLYLINSGETLDCTGSLLSFEPVIDEGQNIPFLCTVSQPCNKVASVLFQRETYGNWETAAVVYPNETVVGNTLSNGVNYHNRSSGEVLGNGYYYTITRSMIEDNGFWRCVINKTSFDKVDSDEVLQIVNADKDKLIVQMNQPSEIILGSSNPYLCKCERVFPNVSVTWFVNEVHYDNGTTVYTRDDAIFAFESSNKFTFTVLEYPKVLCLLENTFGTIWTKNETAENVDVYAPARIEEFTVSHQYPTPSDFLLMQCVASGSNNSVIWLHNTSYLDGNMFTRNDTNVKGDFSFGQNIATSSIVTWKMTASENSCENLYKYDGKYKCRASADRGKDIDSDEKEVYVQYAPILVDAEDEIIDAMINETRTMTCHVECASPSDISFTWTSENNRDGIEANSPIIEILVTEDDFHDMFTCAVKNTIGEVIKKFSFNQITTTTAPPTTVATENTSEDTPDVTTAEPENPPNQALVVANAVIWSLCGVVAIVLVCLALYHYRQIQDGKKRHHEHSDEICLTDDEEKPCTLRDTGVYDDISPACSNSHDVGGAVGGLPREELYAEVQNPSQVSKVEQQQRKHESPNKPATGKQNSNVTKPSVPVKPNVQSIRSSRTSTSGGFPSPGINQVGAPYDNAEGNVYANCDQRPVPNNNYGAITYADLALQHEDPYDEGAPPVPKKNITDQEPVQYASIKH